MPLVQYVATALALQIEGFPKEAKNEEGKEARPFERSCVGSLHLRPGSTLDLTADEYAHIKAKRPEVFSSLRCMTVPSAKPEPVTEDNESSGDDSTGDAPKAYKPKRS